MSDVVQSPTVEAARAEDWEAGLTDHLERGGWIRWQGSPPHDPDGPRDDINATYVIVRWQIATGAVSDTEPDSDPRDVIEPGQPPQNDSLSFNVGHYHQHPPLDATRPQANYNVGPSDEDKDRADRLGSPGVVRDFTTNDRTDVCDYPYGPATQRSN
jgi:hypothetical protein